MPEWFLPFAAALLAVLVLNVALLVQRSKEWQRQFLRELDRWDGRLPQSVGQAGDGDQSSSRFPSGS